MTILHNRRPGADATSVPASAAAPTDDPPQAEWASTPDGTYHRVSVGDIALDGGATIPDVTMAFSRWGRPNAARDNIVLVLHALTADTYVTGPADADHVAAGWWDGLIGPGAAVDTDEWCVIAANVLGGCNGSTGPSSISPDGKPWGSRFPHLTVLDQVRAEAALLDELGVTSVAAAVAPSASGTTALVSLQEANALARLDIATATFTQITPLGVTDRSLAGNGIDYTTWAEWERLDAHEMALGAQQGRERVKVVPRADMISAGRQ